MRSDRARDRPGRPAGCHQCRRAGRLGHHAHRLRSPILVGKHSGRNRRRKGRHHQTTHSRRLGRAGTRRRASDSAREQPSAQRLFKSWASLIRQLRSPWLERTKNKTRRWRSLRCEFGGIAVREEAIARGSGDGPIGPRDFNTGTNAPSLTARIIPAALGCWPRHGESNSVMSARRLFWRCFPTRIFAESAKRLRRSAPTCCCRQFAASGRLIPRPWRKSFRPLLHHSPTPSLHRLSDALELARAKPNRILLTGSLHFAGEALATLGGDMAAFEECSQ